MDEQPFRGAGWERERLSGRHASNDCPRPGLGEEERMPVCKDCKEIIDDPTYTWPTGKKGEHLCQNCWESACSKAWWRMLEEYYCS